MVFRDDDINYTTDLVRFKKIDGLFKEYKVDHVIAVLTNRLAEHKELIKYIKANKHIKPQLHGFEHIDYTGDPEISRVLLKQAVEQFESIFGFKPDVFYPPWNKTNDILDDIVKNLGMSAKPHKISLSQYVRANGDVIEGTINFHYWADEDTMFLEPALRIWTSS